MIIIKLKFKKTNLIYTFKFVVHIHLVTQDEGPWG